jgi:hypothetical protein
MVVIASISLSFAAIVGTLTLVFSVGALIFLTGHAHGGTERRIRRFTDAEGTFSQRVDAAIDLRGSNRRTPRARWSSGLHWCVARDAGPTGVLFPRWSTREQGDIDAKDDDCRNWTSVRQRGSGRDARVDGRRKLPDGDTNTYASSRCADCDRHTGGDGHGDGDHDSQRDANRLQDGYGDTCLTHGERGEGHGRRRSWL